MSVQFVVRLLQHMQLVLQLELLLDMLLLQLVLQLVLLVLQPILELVQCAVAERALAVIDARHRQLAMMLLQVLWLVELLVVFTSLRVLHTRIAAAIVSRKTILAQVIAQAAQLLMISTVHVGQLQLGHCLAATECSRIAAQQAGCMDAAAAADVARLGAAAQCLGEQQDQFQAPAEHVVVPLWMCVDVET